MRSPALHSTGHSFLLAITMALSMFGECSTRGAKPETLVPDFSVTSPVDGKVFKLSDAKGKYVALHFLLKTECPFCLKHTRDYATQSAGTSDVVQIFLKPDSADEIKSWASKVNGPAGKSAVTIYRDADATLARRFSIPDGYAFHGQSVHYPALVLIDPKGKEAFRYVGKSNTDRLPYEKFAAKLAELRRP